MNFEVSGSGSLFFSKLIKILNFYIFKRTKNGGCFINQKKICNALKILK